MDFDKDPTLQEWTREQPLAVLALDSADRAVLRIAGKSLVYKSLDGIARFTEFNHYLNLTVE